MYEVRGVELIDLLRALLGNPSSQFHAAVAGWTFPFSREHAALTDLADLMLMRWTGDKYQPMPRPTDAARVVKGKSPEAAMRQLRPHLFNDL